MAGFTLRMRRSATGQSCASPPVNRMARSRPLASAVRGSSCCALPRAANSLFLLPPFPPEAERCTLTCVESIICVSTQRPFPASSRNRFSQIPRAPSAQNDYRSLWRTILGGQSHQRQPLLSTCTMPLITRRSSDRSTPRTSVGRWVRSDSIAGRSAKTDFCARPDPQKTNHAIWNQGCLASAANLMSHVPSARVK